MAFSATTHWESTGGADGNTGGGGGFDPANANMATDLAATSATGTAPVVTSASYNFIARDNGAWLFIQAVTNWKKGWYPITSTSGNSATLNATAGSWVDYLTMKPGLTNGCATTASPTGGTWSVDYSQGSGAGITYTDLVIAVTTTDYTSAAFPAGKNLVGNILAVSSGVNFTVQRVQIVSVAGTTATCDKSLGTAAAVAGNGKLGGALATPGQAGALHIGGNTIWQKSGTSSVTSATPNIASGCISLTAGPSAALMTRIIGYGSVRGDGGTKPVLQASGITAFTMLALAANSHAENLDVDGASLTSSRGIMIAVGARAYRCIARNCKNYGMNAGGSGAHMELCEVTGCSTIIAMRIGQAIGCTSHDNTITGAEALGSGCNATNCVFSNNSGATSDGLQTAGVSVQVTNCTMTGNGRHGFYNTTTSAAICQTLVNCVATGNAGYGFTGTAAADYISLYNCAGWSNTSGDINSAIISTQNQIGFITLTADPWVASGSNNFAPNNTPGGGALLRATGIPGASTALKLPGLSTLGYLDVGAAQSKWGGVMVNPGMAGGLR